MSEGAAPSVRSNQMTQVEESQDKRRPERGGGRKAVVVTTIFPPNQVMRRLAQGCRDNNDDFVVVGDAKGPDDFDLPGCRFFSLEDQWRLDFSFAEACPTGHYARKAIGYLIAIRDGANVIQETDDDNLPADEFFAPRERLLRPACADGVGWLNVYRYFGETPVWPRGLPLDEIGTVPPPRDELNMLEADCPIQQGLANGAPDVDAIHRLIFPESLNFAANAPVALGAGSWSPFNSQNTTWWRDAFALLYLPAYCSFRMTDIWRAFIAQRIAWANGWRVLFHAPTVHQDRNFHDLMRDFEDEIPGYLENRQIAEILEKFDAEPGVENIPGNMRGCYDRLAAAGILDEKEPDLLDLWLRDLAAIT
jgi:hypothetical protein